MSFSQSVKIEILNNKLSKKKTLSLLQGLIFTSSRFENEHLYIIRLNKSIISETIRELLRSKNIQFFWAQANRNWIVVRQKDVDIESQPADIQSFFAGLFLGGGSTSSPKAKTYHLEISFMNFERFQKIVNLLKLNNLEVDFHSIVRNNKNIIYLKKIDQIIFFLQIIGAVEHSWQLEETRLNRDFKLNSNRLVNFDFFNTKRLVEASRKHISYFHYIQENNLEFHFSNEELTFFKIRKENPEYSLQDIANILKKDYNIIKTKGGLNHWLIKLKKVVNERK
ncbi:DNA-binding protein WhiA [Mesomycoplasma conjunctivae]|uniref:DNA-binding protein WhiA n=1 Tax=Mesomycoplasma conjunctivae TaxID=45361 RepID=UPI003DA23D00